MTGRRHIRDLSDDELIDVFREAYEVMEPVPQYVLDQGYAAFTAAHELRQGGFPVPGLPDHQPPGEVVVMEDRAALLGHQLPGAASAMASAAPGSQTTRTGWGRRLRAGVAGADRVGGRKTPSHWRNTAPAHLKVAARYLVYVGLGWLVGQVAGELWLAYRT